MKISIGDKNSIKSSAIGENNKVKPDNKKKNIIKDIFIGVIVTIIGGIILAIILKMLNIA